MNGYLFFRIAASLVACSLTYLVEFPPEYFHYRTGTTVARYLSHVIFQGGSATLFAIIIGLIFFMILRPSSERTRAAEDAEMRVFIEKTLEDAEGIKAKTSREIAQHRQ